MEGINFCTEQKQTAELRLPQRQQKSHWNVAQLVKFTTRILNLNKIHDNILIIFVTRIKKKKTKEQTVCNRSLQSVKN